MARKNVPMDPQNVCTFFRLNNQICQLWIHLILVLWSKGCIQKCPTGLKTIGLPPLNIDKGHNSQRRNIYVFQQLVEFVKKNNWPWLAPPPNQSISRSGLTGRWPFGGTRRDPVFRQTLFSIRMYAYVCVCNQYNCHYIIVYSYKPVPSFTKQKTCNTVIRRPWK